jgi:hypothetical protein
MRARSALLQTAESGTSAGGRRLARLAAAWVAVVLAGSCGVVVAALGPEALWRAPAHESEARSLLATALFPGHALRELPHLALLSLLFLFAWAPPSTGREARRLLGALGLATVGMGSVLFAWAALEAGPAAAWADLCQARAAPDLAGAGIHFRLHLASDLVLGGTFFAAGRLLGGPPAGGRLAWLAPAGAAAMLALGALVWGVDGVAGPRFVGHALREVETHAVVTLPALLAGVLWWRAEERAARSPGAVLRERPVVAALGVAAAAGVFLLAGLPGVDVARDGSAPGRSVPLNLAAHHVEHLLDVAYLLVAAAVAITGDRA